MSAELGRAPAAPPGLAARMPRLLGGKRAWEASDTVVAASSGLVAIIIAVFVLLCVEGYSSTIETNKARTQTAANVVAEGTRWVVASTLSVLRGTADAIGNDAANAGAETLVAFRAMASTLPADLSFAVYDQAGSVVAAASSPEAAQSIADTGEFRALARGAAWTLTAQQNEVADGKAGFGVLLRLGTAGRFAGVVTVGLRAGVLQRLAEAQSLGPGSTISIVRADGWLIARDPPLTRPLDLSGTTAFANLVSTDTGSYVSGSSPADGVSRIVSFRHVDDLGYIALASVATDAALAGLWRAIWIVSLLIGPIAVALLLGSFLTARLLRRTQAQSRSLAVALEHNETLFREIHHRVKNNLQSVNSLLQLQPVPREVRADMSRRIFAMSAVHEHIYRSREFSRVRVKDYLHTLVENVRAGYDAGITVVEDIDEIEVERDAATPLGLIVNEVVSNSFKHGFPGGRQGRIAVSLKVDAPGSARLEVRDNGVGFDPAAPSRGIGRRLVDSFVAQLGGEASYANEDGTRFVLRFPLPTG